MTTTCNHFVQIQLVLSAASFIRPQPLQHFLIKFHCEHSYIRHKIKNKNKQNIVVSKKNKNKQVVSKKKIENCKISV